jgi:hypothetical protein
MPRSNFTPIVPSGSGSSSHVAGLSGIRVPTLKNNKEKEDGVSAKINEQDEYSDPDEGVEIVDMENIRQMDWAAPESLRRDRNEGRKKKAFRIKKEVSAEGIINSFPLRLELMWITDRHETDEVLDNEEAAATDEVDLANALDLSESEEEEELEDLIEDFALQADLEQVRLPTKSVLWMLIALPRIRVSDKKDSTFSNFPTRFLHFSPRHHRKMKSQWTLMRHPPHPKEWPSPQIQNPLNPNHPLHLHPFQKFNRSQWTIRNSKSTGSSVNWKSTRVGLSRCV